MVRDLRKTYDGRNFAVDGVAFDVPFGEVFALLGPNGAGKTTTVEILEGYRAKTSGEVRVLGMDPARGGQAYRERIGIVLQECGIEPYLTVREVLAMRAPLYPDARPVGEVIELVGLTDKARSTVRTLSGGQKRRLDLALALIGNPELIYLDEPTTGFDPSARRSSWEIVRNLCSLGKTVLLTTHYMDEAQHLASQVVIMAQGRIVARGTPGEIAGGSESTATIEFDAPPYADLASLPLRSEIDGGRVRIVVPANESATAAVHRLTGWAIERGVELGALTVQRPTLEDVYLQLTAEATPPMAQQ
jgi:ABC-2 type transport system ATP-binding protein